MIPGETLKNPAKMPVVGTDFQFKLHRQGVILHPFRAQELLVRQSEDTFGSVSNVGSIGGRWVFLFPKKKDSAS